MVIKRKQDVIMIPLMPYAYYFNRQGAVIPMEVLYKTNGAEFVKYHKKWHKLVKTEQY